VAEVVLEVGAFAEEDHAGLAVEDFVQVVFHVLVVSEVGLLFQHGLLALVHLEEPVLLELFPVAVVGAPIIIIATIHIGIIMDITIIPGIIGVDGGTDTIIGHGIIPQDIGLAEPFSCWSSC